MRRVYAPPVITPRPSPDSQKTTHILVNNSPINQKSLSSRHDSFRQYISRQVVAKPIRGRELFIRSIRRVIEQIRDRKDRAKNDQQLFATFEEAINIFNELTFMKCVLLKKKLSDPNNRTWTIEFAERGGLQALLSYLEHISNKNLSLLDAILVKETLQCLRAMMNISELFEHVASNPHYVDSIAKGKIC